LIGVDISWLVIWRWFNLEDPLLELSRLFGFSLQNRPISWADCKKRWTAFFDLS